MIVLVLFLVAISSCVADVYIPYEEDFQSSTTWQSNWTYVSTSIQDRALISDCYRGSRCYVTPKANFGGYDAQRTFVLTSPIIRATNVQFTFLRFALFYNLENTSGIQIQFNDGSSWLSINVTNNVDFTYVPALKGNGITGYGGRWRIIQVQLPLYTSSFSVRFIFRSGNAGIIYDGAAIDFVQVFQVKSSMDSSPCPEVASPTSDFVVSTRDFNVEGEIGVKFSWNLPANFFNMTIGYSEGYHLLLNSDVYYTGFDTEYVSFFDTPNLSWSIASSLPCPVYTIGIESEAIITNFPYEESFESGMGMWLIQSAGRCSTWTRGSPSRLFASGCADGNFCVFNGDASGNTGYKNLDRSWMLSPIFDFSLATEDPILEFSMSYYTECFDHTAGLDGVSVQVYDVQSSKWSLIGNKKDSEWFNVEFPSDLHQGFCGNSTWKQYQHSIQGVKGKSRVMIRFYFVSDDGISFEGVAIDKIRIQLKQDVSKSSNWIAIGGGISGGVLLVILVAVIGDSFVSIPLTTIKHDSVTTFGSHIINYSDIDIERKIGEGSFGSVYKGTYLKTVVAVKQFQNENVSASDLLKEAEVMKEIPSHPNVVLFRGVTVPPDPISIVMDFCDGGSLISYLEKNKGKISHDRMIQIAGDIGKGMLFLHRGVRDKEVIHRDLAARNILMYKDGTCAVSDFGLARIKTHDSDSAKTKSHVGPVKWMAPESIKKQIYSIKTDTFSYGVVLYEIATQDEPWKGVPFETVAATVASGDRMDIPKNVPFVFQELMEKCWRQNPNERPDFNEILSILDASKLSPPESESERLSKLQAKQDYYNTGLEKFEEYNLSN